MNALKNTAMQKQTALEANWLSGVFALNFGESRIILSCLLVLGD